MFDSARAKIVRASEHLQFLKHDFVRFREQKPYDIRQELDAETGQKSIVYYPTVDIPASWSVVIGEVLYDLRSALDHVAFTLNGGIDGSEFPIFLTQKDFSARDRRGDPKPGSGLWKIRGIRDEKIRTAIQEMQPFIVRKPNLPRQAICWALHKLCIIDKHRRLHICRRQLVSGRVNFIRYIPIREMRSLAGGTLEKRTVLFSYTPAILDNEVDVEVDFTFEIAFDERDPPSATGKPVIGMCEHMVAEVETMIGKIEAVL